MSWNGTSGWCQDNAAFIYSITKGYKVSKQNGTSSIHCYSGDGPVFGGGNDIYVADNCNSNSNSHCNPSTWTLPSGESYIAGKYNFTVKEIEVYSVVKQ